MKFHSVLYITGLALSHQAWAAGPATTSSGCQTNLVVDGHLGPYPVSIYDHEVKTSRPDPLAPTPQLRRLMITIYRPFLDNFTCPLEYQSHFAYAPPVVAAALVQQLPMPITSPNGSSILAPVQLVNCSRPVPPSSPSGPLLLFSPGYAGTHHIYASTLQAAASSGYTVVAIDHTYEAAAVVFPDGYVAYTSNVTNMYDSAGLPGENFLQSVRDADSVSVLDAIERGDVPGLGRYSNSSSSSNSGYGSNSTSGSSLTPLRAVMYGHSFGGSTAANVAASDARVLAAAAIDSFFYAPVANGTIRKPLFMLQAESSPASTDWSSFYSEHVHGWKTWVRPNNTAHYGYTDLPILVDLLGIRGTVIPEEVTGTIESRRLQEIVWRYTLQFFDYILKGTTPDLLYKSNAKFPDVAFIAHADA